MLNVLRRSLFATVISLSATQLSIAAAPELITKNIDVVAMKEAKTSLPLFKSAYETVKNNLDVAMQTPIDVPVPKDPGGGYTHEQHKYNYKLINDAGTIYQLSGEKKYADFAKKILLAYADLYPTLTTHPYVKSSSPGRLFWQSLNEAVWLVYSIQGYVGIVDALTPTEKDKIENQLFRNLAHFLSEEQPAVFNKIHNHGTWATAAVGMTGYALGDKDMVEKSLYGLDKSGKGGFMRQLDELFSPDGYFNEGPYYQRYALMPFVLFSKTIQVNEPERKIFEHRNGVLKKAIYSAIELSYNGKLLPVNDAIKDKGIDTTELVYAASIGYGLTGDTGFLDIAKYQDRILLTGDGLHVAQDLSNNKLTPFDYRSSIYRDGAQGTEGALAVFRSSAEPGHEALIAKYTSQGLGHGHFDKLGWAFYDNNHEIVTDYGAARFLNIATKLGGGYLKENKTWANQSVAHNVLVVDEKSHFKGNYKTGNKFAPNILGSVISDNLKLISGTTDKAYDGVKYTRTHALVSDKDLEFPIVVDLMKVESKKAHQYDVPVYYNGHIMDINFPVMANTEGWEVLGKRNGYQHLWVTGEGTPDNDLAQITWLTDNRFYTYSTRTDKQPKMTFVQLGANDPDYNLRSEKGFMTRLSEAKDHTFVSVLEPHGVYNGRDEYVKKVSSQVVEIKNYTNRGNDFVIVKMLNGKSYGIAISYSDKPEKKHKMKVNGKNYSWTGAGHLFVF